MELTRKDFEFLMESESNAAKYAAENKGCPAYSWVKPKSLQGKINSIDGKVTITFNNYPEEDVFEFDYVKKEFFGVPFSKVIELFDALESTEELYAADVDIERVINSLGIKWIKYPWINIEVICTEVDDSTWDKMMDDYNSRMVDYYAGELNDEPIHPSAIKGFIIKSWKYND